eukprot:6568184-Pyramimonas_sp.AAC.1
MGDAHASCATGTFSGAPYGPTKRCTGWGEACGLRHRGLQWSLLWGHETLYRVGETHAGCATGNFGGAP